MFVHFFCLCLLVLTIKLNFNISKVACWTRFEISACKSPSHVSTMLFGFRLIFDTWK